jgi:predicted nucleic acid-binding protein
MPGSFFDTDVLLGIASGEPGRADRVEELIDRGGSVSVQVLNEIAHVARRKMGMSWPDARCFISAIRRLLKVQALTTDLHEDGMILAERHGLSVYDAMIAAAALHAGCDTLWSEDMRHGMVIDGQLRVINPFRAEMT